jgi:hypothetical protein
MASQIESILLAEQHAFLDLAKEFNWEEVKRRIIANPSIVGVQPCGREGAVRWSALHQAAFSGNLDAVRLLLDHNADLHATNSEGRTPLGVAKNAAVRALLAKAGAAQHIPTPLRIKHDVIKSCKSGSAIKVMKKITKGKAKSKIAKGKRGKALVYKGKFAKTRGGLTKDDLSKSKAGKIVSTKMQMRGKKSYTNIKSWVDAFVKARIALGLTGFVAIRNGSPLYAKTMELYRP